MNNNELQLENIKLREQIHDLQRELLKYKTATDMANTQAYHYKQVFTELITVMNKAGFEAWEDQAPPLQIKQYTPNGTPRRRTSSLSIDFKKYFLRRKPNVTNRTHTTR